MQITVAEEVGGQLGRVLRHGRGDGDMFQNHLLQLLMVTAMEAPVRYEADAIRDEKVKVLQAVRPLGGASSHGHAQGQYRIHGGGEVLAGAGRRRLRRSSFGSTTGGGRVCRFICGVAR